MYQINKVCIDILLLLILSVSSISAQVVTTSNGYPVIDLSALNPLGAVLSSAEAENRRTTMNLQKPSNSEILGATLSASGENGTWNAKMSIKYQVMQNNLGPIIDWTSAWKACSSYNSEDGRTGQWRLPTQRELQMIWILYPQLLGTKGFTGFFANRYWTSTEVSETKAWFVGFGIGDSSSSSKSDLSGFVRCVRDL